jgi:hypothetical protein
MFFFCFSILDCFHSLSNWRYLMIRLVHYHGLTLAMPGRFHGHGVCEFGHQLPCLLLPTMSTHESYNFFLFFSSFFFFRVMSTRYYNILFLRTKTKLCLLMFMGVASVRFLFFSKLLWLCSVTRPQSLSAFGIKLKTLFVHHL